MLQTQHICFLIAFLFVLVRCKEVPTHFDDKIGNYVKRLFSEECVSRNENSLNSADGTDAFRELYERIKNALQPGWINGPDYYQFYVENRYVTYNEALKFCESKKGRVMLESARYKTLRRWVQTNILAQTRRSHHWWINVSDQQQEGNWVWGDGILVVRQRYSPTTNWYRRQPDNTNDADCAYVSRKLNYAWDDVICSNKAAVVCERRIFS